MINGRIEAPFEDDDIPVTAIDFDRLTEEGEISFTGRFCSNLHDYTCEQCYSRVFFPCDSCEDETQEQNVV